MERTVKVIAIAIAVVAVVAVSGAAIIIGDEGEQIEYRFGIVIKTSSANTVDNSLLPDGWVWVYANIYIYNESEVDIDETELPAVLVDGDGDGETEEYEATVWSSVDQTGTTNKFHYRWIIWYAVPAFYLDGELVEDGLVNDAVELSYPSSWTEYSS